MNHPDETTHEGTAILIKHTITYYEQLKYATAAIQATSIRVKGLLYEITVAAVYCPPRHNLKKENFEAFFLILGPKFLAGGDYNGKHVQWGPRLTTTKGHELSKVIQENNYSYISTGSPAYWPMDTTKIPDLLDFFVTKEISTTYRDIQLSYDLTSDQTISTTVMGRQPAPRLHVSQKNGRHVQTYYATKRI